MSGLALPPPFRGTPMYASPSGWEEIVQFSAWDPKVYLDKSGAVRPAWRADAMRIVRLPEPCTLSWDPSAKVERVTLHKNAAQAFQEFYARVHDAGLWPVVSILGGTYEFRRIGGSPMLSLHSLAMADDRDPKRNARGVPAAKTTIGGTVHGHRVIRIAEEVGLTCGARFKTTPDAMHFQFARGY